MPMSMPSSPTSSNVPASSARSDRQYIADFAASQYVSGIFSISNAQLGRTKTDKPFLKCILRDKTGEVSARMWSIDQDHFSRIPSDGFVYIEGETQPYQGELQLILRVIDATEVSDEMLRDLLPVTKRDIEQMYAEVLSLLETLEHPAMKGLAKVYTEDAPLMTAFKRAPAAKSIHHAYIGGLLEHTLTLMNLANVICPFYPAMNRDIVLFGLFIHDLGKTRELVYDRTFAYTDRGELIGHIVDGAIMLGDRVQKLMSTQGIRPPVGLLTVLQHIVLSHHGVPEFGAAKLPATPEAILISCLDNLDAKAAMSLHAARPDRGENAPKNFGGNFTEKNFALGTKLFKLNPLDPA